MVVAVGADHAGFALKQVLGAYLRQLGFGVIDVGTHSVSSVDYPDLAHQVAEAIKKGKADRGVLVCGSAIGMAIAANRHVGVRAAVLRDAFDAQMSREHNDANVACFGGRVTLEQEARRLLEIWLRTAFAGGRHAARVEKIDHKGPRQ